MHAYAFLALMSWPSNTESSSEPCILQDACPACNASDHKLHACGHVLGLARRAERRQMLLEGLKQGRDRACEAAITCITYSTCVKPLTQGLMLDPSTRPAAVAPAPSRQAS